LANATWIYQGRQAHGWFGSGTAPKDAAPEKPGNTPFNLANRVRWVAHGAVAEMPRAQRARFEARLGQGALKSLTEAMSAWVRSAGLDAESFRAHFLPHAGARAAAQLQVVAAAVGYSSDLRPAMTALAEAVQAIGPDNAPRVLAAAAARAANSAAPAAAPAPIIKAQAPPSEGEPPTEERLGPEGEPLNYNEQLRVTEYRNAYKELQARDPHNPALGPFLQRPNRIPSEVDLAKLQAALATVRSNPTVRGRDVKNIGVQVQGRFPTTPQAPNSVMYRGCTVRTATGTLQSTKCGVRTDSPFIGLM
jgi:hypothetical protein